jgi:hypothetical protein
MNEAPPMTIDDVLFYGVYLSQILLISLYVPSRVLRRARGLIKTHPPAEFPKLYPMPVATIDRTLRAYRNLNGGVVMLGLALLIADWWLGYTIDGVWRIWEEGEQSPARDPQALARIYMFYTVLQGLLSIALFQYWESRYFKRMRAVRGGIRTAELRARRLFDFVSPALLGTAVAAYVAVSASLLFLELPQSAIMIASLTACHVWGAGCFAWMFYGRKQDPHQAAEDRARMIRAVWRVTIGLSILLSAIFGTVSLLVAFRLFEYMPFVFSAFVQVIVVVSTGRFCLVVPFDQQSFEVYRANATSGTSLAINK